MPLQDERLYEVTCPSGHPNRIVLQQPLFDILSEVAIQAIADGYLREAVSSAAASLERFQEFYVRVVHAEHGRPAAGLMAAWKTVSKQSERQLGMFVAAYLAETGAAPPLLSQKMVELRNRVVHQGRIPTRREAITYVQAVVDLIFAILPPMQSQFATGMMTYHTGEISSALVGANADAPASTFSSHLVYPLIPTGNETPPNVAEEAERRIVFRRFL